MFLRRPIGAWLIFAYVIVVFGYAVWNWVALIRTSTIDPEYGFWSLIVSLFPAGVLFATGLAMLALTKWAIAASILNALVAATFLPLELSMTTVVWFAVSLLLTAYAIWLRRKSVLT